MGHNKEENRSKLNASFGSKDCFKPENYGISALSNSLALPLVGGSSAGSSRSTSSASGQSLRHHCYGWLAMDCGHNFTQLKEIFKSNLN
jgi:hypothetical protein